MKKELYDLIETYLAGALPEEKRQEVEARLASDEDFRQEVELHRALQESYTDPDRWQLKKALLEAMKEPLPPGDPPMEEETAAVDNWKKWQLWIPVALLLGVGIWYFGWRDTPLTRPNPTDIPPVQTPNSSSPTNDQKEAPVPQGQPTEQKIPESQTIAMADPSNFEENPSMEGLVAVRGGGELTLALTHPKPEERFNPQPTGKTTLRFSGTVEGMPPNVEAPLQLLIFNNKNAKTPIRAQVVQLNSDAKGQAVFILGFQVGFPMGLYYFRFEESEGEMLMAGKFFIGGL